MRRLNQRKGQTSCRASKRHQLGFSLLETMVATAVAGTLATVGLTTGMDAVINGTKAVDNITTVNNLRSLAFNELRYPVRLTATSPALKNCLTGGGCTFNTEQAMPVITGGTTIFGTTADPIYYKSDGFRCGNSASLGVGNNAAVCILRGIGSFRPICVDTAKCNKHARADFVRPMVRIEEFRVDPATGAKKWMESAVVQNIFNSDLETTNDTSAYNCANVPSSNNTGASFNYKGAIAAFQGGNILCYAQSAAFAPVGDKGNKGPKGNNGGQGGKGPPGPKGPNCLQDPGVPSVYTIQY